MAESIVRIMSMPLSSVRGLVWYGSGSNGYKYVFPVGTVLAVLNFIATRFVAA